jgi:hypothetical protein
MKKITHSLLIKCIVVSFLLSSAVFLSRESLIHLVYSQGVYNTPSGYITPSGCYFDGCVECCTPGGTPCSPSQAGTAGCSCTNFCGYPAPYPYPYPAPGGGYGYPAPAYGYPSPYGTPYAYPYPYPYPTPTYDVTGVVFEDENSNSSRDPGDQGLSGFRMTLRRGSTTSGSTVGSDTTDSTGRYRWTGIVNGTYNVQLNENDVPYGWRVGVSNPRVGNVSGGNLTMNFPIEPNPPTNLQVLQLYLTDNPGTRKTVFDPGERVYVEVHVRNDGSFLPWSESGYVEGAINMNRQSVFGNYTTLVDAAEPDDFVFRRNLNWPVATTFGIGSFPSHPRQDHFLNSRYSFAAPNTPGTYRARVFLDYDGQVPETTGNNIADNQQLRDYSVRNYVIQGTIFEDADEDGNRDPGEIEYTGSIPASSITDSNNIGGGPTMSGANFTFSNRRTGEHQIRFTPPVGFKATHPTGVYVINLNLGATTVSPCTTTLPNGPACSTPNNDSTTVTVANINFGISKAEPWIQNSGLNARFDRSLPMEKIPTSADPSYGSYAMKPFGTNITSPGTLFTGTENITLAPGSISASPFNWKVGGSFSDVTSTKSFPLPTSFTYLYGKLKDADELSSARGGCNNYANCTLGNNFRPGIYKVTASSLTLNNFSFRKQNNADAGGDRGDYIFLIDGSLTIRGPIEVRDNRTALFSVKNNITVATSVGTAPVAYPPTTTSASSLGGIEGMYIAGNDFHLPSTGECGTRTTEDLQLFVDGTIVTNAQNAGGTFDLERTLCTGNLTHPVIVVRPRLDMLLTTPLSVKQNSYTWSELAP